MQQHYAKLPKNTEGARKDWDPDQVPGDSTDDKYWGAYSKVAIKGAPLVEASGDGFAVTVALELTDAETNKASVEEHTLEISGTGEKLLITGEQKG